jgi:sugar fermentation stimulation protein A
MRFDFVTEPATFLARPNRYRVDARLHACGTQIAAHCADPGRLRELLLPGVTVHVSPAATRLPGLPPRKAVRKTAWDLRFVEHPEHGQLVSLDTRVPNRVFAEGIAAGFFPPWRGGTLIGREVPLRAPWHAGQGGIVSRIDFRIADEQGVPWWVEVKSASLVEGGVARFPDAVTARGRRHVEELAALVQAGERAAVVFIVQRPDARELRPQWNTDPAFAAALVAAEQAGVHLLAATCSLTTQEICLERMVRVVTAR